MKINRMLCRTLALVTLGGAIATAAHADEVFGTNDPFGGWIGILGTDVFELESKAVRFTPGADYTLDQVGVWFWHNGGPGTAHPNVTLTLRTDAGGGEDSYPSNEILETWVVDVSATGFGDPALYTVDSVTHSLLETGQHYWIAAEARDAPALDDPVWAYAGIGNDFTAIGDPQTGVWQPGGYGAVMTLTIEGTLVSDNYRLDISDPFRSGRNNTFTVTGARPSASTWLAYGVDGYGATPVDPLGVTLDLAAPAQAGPAVQTDASGNVRWDVFTPRQAAGLRVWLQSVQRGAKSQVVEVFVD